LALTDFLYRCPHCGTDPLEGEKTRASCRACGSRFEAAPRDGGIHIVSREGTWIDPAWKLAADMEKQGAPLPESSRHESEFAHEALARARFSNRQDPLRHRGRLLGFVERFGPPVKGTLRITPDLLRFDARDRTSHEWPLGRIRALQAASSSVQITLDRAVLVSFRLEDDSTRRWEELLSHALRQLWRREGRGEIVEFQPRIRAKPHDR